MNVRHVHAKSNEYIAVHRGRTYRIPLLIPNGNAIFYIIGGILLLAFWKPLLTLAVAGLAFYFTISLALQSSDMEWTPPAGGQVVENIGLLLFHRQEMACFQKGMSSDSCTININLSFIQWK